MFCIRSLNSCTPVVLILNRRMHLTKLKCSVETLISNHFPHYGMTTHQQLWLRHCARQHPIFVFLQYQQACHVIILHQLQLKWRVIFQQHKRVRILHRHYHQHLFWITAFHTYHFHHRHCRDVYPISQYWMIPDIFQLHQHELILLQHQHRIRI